MDIPRRRVTLLTDFGTADGYVAAMKGVIAAIAPHVVIDDASHGIAPGDVSGAAWALGAYWHHYPVGTIHVIVVDPGVGSDRRAVAVVADHRILVAPDNGVLSCVLRDAEAVEVVAIDPARVARGTVSATFHGRDIFAPAAADLANGCSIDQVGTRINDALPLIRLPVADTLSADHGGIITHVDRFGNLITNIAAGSLASTDEHAVDVMVGAARFPVRSTYSDVEPGEPVAVVGSRGVVELSVRDGSAAEMFGFGRGRGVTLLRHGPPAILE